MLVKSRIRDLPLDISTMKVTQSAMLPATLLEECAHLGALLARLRIARHIKQADAALRAGLSRNTAYRLEKGDPGIAIGQVFRYLQAIAPGSTLMDLLSEKEPALRGLSDKERTRRVRDLSPQELEKYDF